MPLRIIFAFKTASSVFFSKISSVLNIDKHSKLESRLHTIHRNIYSSIDVDSIIEKWSKLIDEWKAKEFHLDNAPLKKFFQPSETCYDNVIHVTFAMFELSTINWFLKEKCTPPKFFFPGFASGSKPLRNYQELSKTIAVFNNSLTEILVNSNESIILLFSFPT